MTLIQQIAAGFILGALLLGFIRLLMGPDAASRVISADTMSVTVTAALVGFAAYFDSALFLDVALVYGAISFIGIITIARVIKGDSA